MIEVFVQASLILEEAEELIEMRHCWSGRASRSWRCAAG